MQTQHEEKWRVHDQNNRQEHKTQERPSNASQWCKQPGVTHWTEGRDQISTRDEADRIKGSGHGGISGLEGRDQSEARGRADWTEGGGHSGVNGAEGRDQSKARGGADWTEGGVSEAEGKDQIEAKGRADGAWTWFRNGFSDWTCLRYRNLNWTWLRNWFLDWTWLRTRDLNWTWLWSESTVYCLDTQHSHCHDWKHCGQRNHL